jgi:CRP-like cAMP-binding protein
LPALVGCGTVAGPAFNAAHSILGALNEDGRRDLLRWAKIRDANRREVIARQGDSAHSVVVVLDGYLKLSTPLADGSEALLDILGPGDSAGEMSALQDLPWEANLTALSRCRLMIIDGRRFRQSFDRQPEALCAILRSATSRLRRATEQLLDSRSLTVRARLAKALLRIGKMSVSVVNGSAHLPFRLSQSELGAMVGVCREIVNKCLGAWRDTGWIEMSAGTVMSIDTAAMSGVLRDEMYGEVDDGRAVA